MFQNPSDEMISRILQSAKTIAVVGLSNNPQRDSYHVAQYLQKHGYRIIPINPTVDEVLGEKAVPNLDAIDDEVDIINVFRRSSAIPEIVDSALKLSAPVIWTQLGIHHEEAAEKAVHHGKTVIMDKCIKIEHARLCAT